MFINYFKSKLKKKKTKTAQLHSIELVMSVSLFYAVVIFRLNCERPEKGQTALPRLMKITGALLTSITVSCEKM